LKIVPSLPEETETRRFFSIIGAEDSKKALQLVSGISFILDRISIEAGLKIQDLDPGSRFIYIGDIRYP
jgi:hypothetical protein